MNVNYKYHYDNAISAVSFYHTIEGDDISMVADRIKALRETKGYTQAELAKRLGVTRSSVNAWELGISVPSTQYIVELATIFDVSTDYLLCVDTTASIMTNGLTEEDVRLLYELVQHLRSKNKGNCE